ncbi:MAG: hypothetical protein KKF14_01355, partial [Alphaproteobacteria bacterium]|nr:hypothetical protein [Alphaproteobacteria bacterium]
DLTVGDSRTGILFTGDLMFDVNGGVKAGQCGGVKAGHWQGCDADMEMAPIGAISMSASSFSIRDR